MLLPSPFLNSKLKPAPFFPPRSLFISSWFNRPRPSACWIDPFPYNRKQSAWCWWLTKTDLQLLLPGDIVSGRLVTRVQATCLVFFINIWKWRKEKFLFLFSTGRRRPFWWFPPRGFFFYWKKRDAFAADAIAAVDFLRRRRAWSINALASSLFRSVRPSIDWWGRIRQHVPRPHGALEKLCQRLKKIWWRLKGVEWKGAPNHGALILALFSASPQPHFLLSTSVAPHTHTRC